MSKLAQPMRCTVRHGSSIPGPLEARRRSTRRRMGVATSTGSGSVPSDLAMPPFLGMSWQRSNWQVESQVVWQPPGLVAEKWKQKPWEDQELPSWLLQIPKTDTNPSETEPSSTTIDLEIVEDKHGEGDTRQSLASWKEVLQDCEDLESIRLAASIFPQTLEAAASECTFRRLQEIDIPILSYLDFLGDPTLNFPEAQNTFSFLQLLTRRTTSGSIDGKLARRYINKARRWVSKETNLGNLAEEEIAAILMASLPANATAIYGNSRKIVAHIYLAVWEGIKASKIRGAEDFQPATLRLLLRAAAQDTNVDRGVATALEIITALLPFGQQNVSQYIKTFTGRYLAGSSGTFSTNFQNGQDMARAETLSQAFSSLPSECVLDAIGSLITTLLSQPTTSEQQLGRQNIGRLKGYFHVLAQLQRKESAEDAMSANRTLIRLERKLAGSTPDILSLYLKTQEPSRICIFLLDHWFIPRLADSLAQIGHSDVDGRDLFEIRNRCVKSIIAIESDGPSPYLTIIRHMFDAAPAALSSLIPGLLRLLQHLTDTESLAVLAKEIQSLGLHIPFDDLHTTIDSLAIRDCKAAIHLFKRDERSRLEHCQGLATAILKSPSYHNNVLFTLMLQPRNLNYDDTASVSDSILKRKVFIHELAARLFSSETASPGRALRTFRRLFPRVRVRNSGGNASLATALINATLLPWLRAGRTVPWGVKQWVFSQLEAMKGIEASEEVFEAVRFMESKIRQGRYLTPSEQSFARLSTLAPLTCSDEAETWVSDMKMFSDTSGESDT